MELTAEQLASDENTSSEKLARLAEQSTELARIVTRNANAAPELLRKLATSKDYLTRQNVAANPNTSAELLLSLCYQFPKEVLNNPVFSLLLIENSHFFSCEISIDVLKIRYLIDLEIRRLGWKISESREYLQTHWGKRSRLHLTDNQLLDLLARLRSL
jgi:hypothetical protein